MRQLPLRSPHGSGGGTTSAERGNIFHDLPAGPEAGELVEALVSATGLRIERIVSTGQATPDGEWLDQQRDEWVVLLRGEAALHFEGGEGERIMKPGDWVLIPSRQRHRVTRTAMDEPTVWLAVHYV